MDLRLPTALFGLGMVLVSSAVDAIDRKDVLEQMKNSRPTDLQVLIEKPDAGGLLTIGIYGIKAVGADSPLRQYKIWEEFPADLNIYVETVNCSPSNPLRIKRTATAVYVRNLNPGGPVSDINREDHLVWWAACHPDFAGQDPIGLTEKARELGYSTQLIESQEVLRLPAP